MDFEQTPAAARVLDQIGRTEDLALSPDNRRLAVAGFARNRIVVFDIEFEINAAAPRIRLGRPLCFRDPCLRHPHGIAWLGDDALIVANRRGEAPVFRLPRHRPAVDEIPLAPARLLRGSWWRTLRAPGSVCVGRSADGQVEALFCENYEHKVVRFVVDVNADFRFRSSAVLLEEGLDIPDGIALDPSNRWIAVSNHARHSVAIFDRNGRLRRHSAACGVLSGMCYPHGLRFSPDGKMLLVADAGAPFVRVFQAVDDNWCGAHEPLASIRVMDDETFARGHYNPQEGGPKGITLDRTGRVCGVTSTFQPLAFFDLPAALSSSVSSSAGKAHMDVCAMAN
ncbi:MAG: hypothetical protein KDG50_15985 [Chromatiales bacterium]|nr:hypothetical protein [Chromatiales bacterium]